MQGKPPAVVQKEQLRVWSNVAEGCREILAPAFLMDRTYAEFVADAVFGAHEFGSGRVCEFVCLIDRRSTGEAVDFCRQSVCDVLLVCYCAR